MSENLVSFRKFVDCTQALFPLRAGILVVERKEGAREEGARKSPAALKRDARAHFAGGSTRACHVSRKKVTLRTRLRVLYARLSQSGKNTLVV